MAIIRLSGFQAFDIAGRIFCSSVQKPEQRSLQSHRIYHGHVRGAKNSFVDEVRQPSVEAVLECKFSCSLVRRKHVEGKRLLQVDSCFCQD